MKTQLHVQMLIGFGVGLCGGLVVNVTAGPEATGVVWVTTNITQPAGQLFLRLLFMLVLPLVVSALTVVVSEMSDMRTLGRLGLRTLVLTVVGGCVAASIGVLLTNLVQPGIGIDPQVLERLLATAGSSAHAIVETGASGSVPVSVLAIVPSNVIQAAARNELLPVMVFSVLLGVGCVLTRRASTETFRGTLQGLFEVSMTLIGLVVRLAPIAIACLVFNQAALFGLDLVLRLGSYVGVVLLGLALHVAIVYSIGLRFFGPMSLLFLLRRSQEAFLMGFATASSAATLPTMLLVAEQKLGLPKQLSRFVLTLGVATNRQGTALSQAVTVLFLAQFFGVHLDLYEQLTVMILCVLTSMGGAAIPAGSLPVIAAILAMFGIPLEGLGLILGVDRLLDMCRTAVNVTGNLAVTAIVSRLEQPIPGQIVPDGAGADQKL